MNSRRSVSINVIDALEPAPAAAFDALLQTLGVSGANQNTALADTGSAAAMRHASLSRYGALHTILLRRSAPLLVGCDEQQV